MRLRSAGIIIRNNQTLLMHRRKNQEEYWVVPGGKVEEGETIEQALKREISEELSLEVTSCERSFETHDHLSHTIFFLCQVKSGQPKLGGPELTRNSPDNWYHPEWVDLDKLKDLEIYPESLKDRLFSL